MPSGNYGNKERQSVYKKALIICHEDEKQLTLMQHQLEQNKLQKYIDYKLEEKRLKKELLQLRREQMQLMQEARQRQRDKKTVDDLAKEATHVYGARNRNLDILKLKKKFSLPYVTPTQRNIPKIMKRSLSYESEYFTWTFGLPQIDCPVAKGIVTGKVEKNGKGLYKPSESLKIDNKHGSKATNIVSSVSDTNAKKLLGKEKALVQTTTDQLKLPCIQAPGTSSVHKAVNNSDPSKAKSISDSKLPPIVIRKPH